MGTIYEGVVQHYYWKYTRADANHAGHSRKKRGGADLSNHHYEMGKCSDKRKKRYVDSLKDRLQITCLIHCLDHPPDECKVINNIFNNLLKAGILKNTGGSLQLQKVQKEARVKCCCPICSWWDHPAGNWKWKVKCKM